jgi:hypothetical protein
MTKSFLSHFFNWRIHFCYDKIECYCTKLSFIEQKWFLLLTEFTSVLQKSLLSNKIHFCQTKFTFVKQNSFLSCHRSYSLLLYVNYSPIGCNTSIFGEGKLRISRDWLGFKSMIVTWPDIKIPNFNKGFWASLSRH